MQANRTVAVWRSTDGRVEARLYDGRRFVGHLAEDPDAPADRIEPNTAYLSLPDPGSDLDDVIRDRSAGLYVTGGIDKRDDGTRDLAHFVEWHHANATTHPADALGYQVESGALIPMTTVGGSGEIVESVKAGDTTA